MQLKTPGAVPEPNSKRARTRLALHRRVGVFSLASLVLGASWVGANVLPGLQKSVGSEQAQTASMGWLRMLPGAKAPSPVPSPSPVAQKSQEAPAIGTAEATLIDAPVGMALQAMLSSARYSSVCDPAVVSAVTYSNAGKPRPFWEIVGRIIGAAPAPSAHVIPYWDAYRILPRNVIPVGRDVPPPSATVALQPVPVGAGAPTHRMAGFIQLDPNGARPPVRAALLETRVPGFVPQWRVVFVGDAMLRRSPMEVTRETDPRQNIDVVPVVEDIQADHLVLRGGGDKRLRIPLSKSGVPDVFGYRPDRDAPSSPQPYPYQRDTGMSGSRSSGVY